MYTQKMRALSYIGAEKITFPPKPDGQTDRHTDGRTLVLQRWNNANKISGVKTNHRKTWF